MARKSDSFFIRATVTPDDTDTFVQSDIDLGAYVDAAGKRVLRILNVEAELAASNGLAPKMDANAANFCIWQITTANRTSIQPLSDRSVVAKAQYWARNPDATANEPATVYTDSHMPQHYSDGYLVAVDTLYLGAQAGTDWTASSNLTVNVVMECVVETLTENAAMALALSQQ